MYQLSKETEGATVNHKQGIHLKKGGKSPVIALPEQVYDDLSRLKEPKEPFYSVVQRLIAYYRTKD